MSYSSQALLTVDGDFNSRSGSSVTQQAMIFKDDQRPMFKSLANTVLRGDPDIFYCFTRLAAAGPGIADKVELPNGEVDSSLVTDADLLSLTQANWQVIASLYYNDDGTPIGG